MGGKEPADRRQGSIETHKRAAATHDRAADLHEASAYLHEEHAIEMADNPSRAERARQIADSEHKAAANERRLADEQRSHAAVEATKRDPAGP